MMRAVVKTVSTVCCLGMLAAGLCGCESFVKKFKRTKPLDEEHKKQEVVVAPQEYAASPIDKREQYQQHFILWKAWQDELIDSLVDGGNRKHQLDALKEGIRNLEGMAGLLARERSETLMIKLASFKELERELAWDSYSLQSDQHLRQAERLRAQVIREFSPAKVKDALK